MTDVDRVERPPEDAEPLVRLVLCHRADTTAIDRDGDILRSQSGNTVVASRHVPCDP
jgi:hypothetical protein